MGVRQSSHPLALNNRPAHKLIVASASYTGLVNSFIRLSLTQIWEVSLKTVLAAGDGLTVIVHGIVPD